MIGKIIVAVALLAVIGVLIGGFVAMATGGEKARMWSNRLMRFRVLAQAVAIVIIMLVLYFTSRH